MELTLRKHDENKGELDEELEELAMVALASSNAPISQAIQEVSDVAMIVADNARNKR